MIRKTFAQYICLAVLSLLLSTTMAAAGPTVWQLQNVALAGGGSVTGSFSYDAGADSLSTYSLQVSSSEFPVVNYTFTPANSSIYALSATNISLVDNSAPAPSGHALNLYFFNPLTSAGGTDSLIAGSGNGVGASGSASDAQYGCSATGCDGTFGTRQSIASGAVTTNPLSVPPSMVSGLTPSSVTAGGQAFTLTVNGSAFLSGSTVQWNGAALSTTFISSSQLTSSVSANLIATAGSATVAVANPGGMASNAVTFPINYVVTTTWHTVAGLQTPRAGSAAATGLNGKVYVFGGQDNSGNFLSSVEVYDPLANSWSYATNMPTARIGMVAATGADGRIYVIGGQIPSRADINTVEAFDPSTGTWAVGLSGMPTSRQSMGAAAGKDGKIYVFGGISPAITLNTVEAYDPASDNWIAGLNGMPTARQVATVGTAPNGLIYVVGGFDAENADTKNEVYDPVANSWLTTSAGLPSPAGSAAGGFGKDGKFYVLGGINGGAGEILNTVNVYDPTSNIWSAGPPLSVPRFALSGAIGLDGTIYAISGQEGSFPSAVNTVDALSVTASVSSPMISGLTPSSATAGSQAFTLTVNGAAFLSGSTVQWNGSSLPTTFVNSSQLTSSVSANLIAVAGSASVIVKNPGGASSNTVTLLINAPAPIVTSLNPSSVTTGGSAFILTVNGTGFLSGATVQWNGAALSTTFISSSQLTSSVSANLIAVAGSASVTVKNPGGASSNTVTLLINAPAPIVTSLNPSSVTAGGSAFMLTVNGTGFLSGASIQWDGSSLPATYISPMQLMSSVAASLIASAGGVSVAVVNPGGASSNAVTLPINAPTPVITSLNPSSVTAASSAFMLTVNGTGFLSGATTVWNGSAIRTTFVNPTQLVSSVPATLIASAGNASITVLNPGGALSDAVKFTINTPSLTAPSINPGGVVPVFSSSTTIETGEWVSIYGTNLAGGNSTWTGDFPTSLAGTSVTIDGKPAYLWFVGPEQINLQTPDDAATGSVLVVVTNASGSATATVTLAQFAPSFLLLDTHHVTGIILRSNGAGAYGGGTYDIIGPTGTSLGYATVAAKAGDTIELYGTGFGSTNPGVMAGQAFSGAAPVTNPVTLLINNVPVIPSFAGLSAAGLYQFNLTVPGGLGTGDVPLQASVGGTQTPSGIMLSLQ